MATNSSGVSFQGLSTGIQTDALVQAILNQESQSLRSFQARQDFNKKRTDALTSMKSSINSLMFSLAALQDKLNARTVTSSDTTNAYVTATASGVASGSFDLSVSTVATKARISSKMVGNVAQNLAVADPSAAIFTSGKASFAIQDTDGTIKTFELANNSLNGLKDAINASGSGVTASIINSGATGAGAVPYQLVLTSKNLGTGSVGTGVIALAAIDNQDLSSTTVNPALGIKYGTLTGDFASPTALAGGLSSSDADQGGVSATNAVFTLNGVTLTRQSNTVSDAADGMTFTLKQGGQIGITTLTVAQDKTAATTGIQDVITKYNALLKGYKEASTSTKNADGSINQAPLAGDSEIRTLITKIKATFTGASEGLPGTAAYQNLASLGISTLSDGTLSLNTFKFQTAVEKDATAAMKLLTFSGDSTSSAVSVKTGSSKTVTGAVNFTIDSYTPGGAVTGTLTGTANGTPFSYALTGANGILSGEAGTPLEGLSLGVTGLGSGTLTLSRGAGQAASDLLFNSTLSGTGTIAKTLKTIETQNTLLTSQITQAQSRLDKRKKVLQTQFSKMEVTITRMRAAASSLSNS